MSKCTNGATRRKDTAQLQGLVLFIAFLLLYKMAFHEDFKQHTKLVLWCAVQAGQKHHGESQPLSLPHGIKPALGALGKRIFHQV